MKNYIFITLFSLLILAGSCKKADDTTGDGVTTQPEIISLTSDKSEIEVGGNDPAIIECNAVGGNLSYKWEVDLGDIFPLNDSGSKVRFTGSECCVGDKEISCTVYNDKGEVSDIIKIHIYIP